MEMTEPNTLGDSTALVNSETPKELKSQAAVSKLTAYTADGGTADCGHRDCLKKAELDTLEGSTTLVNLETPKEPKFQSTDSTLTADTLFQKS